jgi:hypothetical protein
MNRVFSATLPTLGRSPTFPALHEIMRHLMIQGLYSEIMFLSESVLAVISTTASGVTASSVSFERGDPPCRIPVYPNGSLLITLRSGSDTEPNIRYRQYWSEPDPLQYYAPDHSRCGVT